MSDYHVYPAGDLIEHETQGDGCVCIPGAKLHDKTPAQLRWMRHNKSGPPSALIGGRVMYREQDITDWINQAFDGSPE